MRGMGAKGEGSKGCAMRGRRAAGSMPTRSQRSCGPPGVLWQMVAGAQMQSGAVQLTSLYTVSHSGEPGLAPPRARTTQGSHHPGLALTQRCTVRCIAMPCAVTCCL